MTAFAYWCFVAFTDPSGATTIEAVEYENAADMARAEALMAEATKHDGYYCRSYIVPMEANA